MQRRIIIGFEDTPQGRDALTLGAILSEITDSQPIVATILPWPHGLMSEADLDRALDLDSEPGFKLARDELSGLNPVTRAIAHRSAAETLTKLADDEDAVMIVIGSCHRGRVGRTLLGGTGTSLVQGAPCAVAVAPTGFAAREERHVLRIAAAYDGSPEAWAALETAIGIAERVHGQLTVLTVAEDAYYGYASSWAILSTGEFHDFEREQKQRVLDLALSRAPAGVDATGRLLSGDAGSILTDVSAEFDLLVAGSRGYGPLKRTMLGSAARDLVAGAGCPVVILPRASAIDPLGVRTPPEPIRTPASAPSR